MHRVGSVFARPGQGGDQEFKVQGVGWTVTSGAAFGRAGAV
jgi:hypothetical protein